MIMAMGPGLLLAAALSAATGAWAALGPRLTGQVPPNASEKVLGEVWEFLKGLGQASSGLTPPELYFSAFDPAKQDEAFTQWQTAWSQAHPDIYEDWICSYSGGERLHPDAHALCSDRPRLKEWIAAHPELAREYPFPAVFRAFHYDGTDRIQLSPGATFTGVVLQGIRMEDLGTGYYAAGHEMLHYVLDSRGIPGPEHHCLFVTPRGAAPSYMSALVDFLVERGYAHFLIRKLGPEGEAALNPCGK